MIGRIGTFANSNALVAATLRAQGQLADQQAQQASGKKSTTFGGLGGDASKLLNLAGQSARLTADNAAASSAATLTQSAYSAVGDILDLATTIRSQLASAVSGTNGSGAITADTAKNWLSTLQSELNTQVGGVYVFGGQGADHAPVDFTDASYAPAFADPPDTGYYQGSTSARSFTTSQGEMMGVGLLASDPGFARLANALSMLAASPGDATTLQSAYSALGMAVTDLGAHQAAISSQAAALDTLVSSNTDRITTLDNLATEIDGADLATATVKVTQYQSQLEALYSAISKLSSDNLLKYL